MAAQFILASGSPRRRDLLASLGIAFTVVKPDIDETQRPNEPPYDYVIRLSIEKARAARIIVENAPQAEGAPHDAALILAADTVVILAADTMGVTETGEILGKPTDADDARAILRRLRGRPHVACTALTILNLTPQVETGSGDDTPQPLLASDEGKTAPEGVAPLQRESGTRSKRRVEVIITAITRTTVHMRDYTDDEIDAYIATGDPFDKAGAYAIQHKGFHGVARIDGSYTNVMGLPIETLRALLERIGYPVSS